MLAVELNHGPRTLQFKKIIQSLIYRGGGGLLISEVSEILNRLSPDYLIIP